MAKIGFAIKPQIINLNNINYFHESLCVNINFEKIIIYYNKNSSEHTLACDISSLNWFYVHIHFCDFYSSYYSKHHYFHFTDKEIEEAGLFPKAIINKNPVENCIVFYIYRKEEIILHCAVVCIFKERITTKNISTFSVTSFLTFASFPFDWMPKIVLNLIYESKQNKTKTFKAFFILFRNLEHLSLEMYEEYTKLYFSH